MSTFYARACKDSEQVRVNTDFITYIHQGDVNSTLQRVFPSDFRDLLNMTPGFVSVQRDAAYGCASIFVRFVGEKITTGPVETTQPFHRAIGVAIEAAYTNAELDVQAKVLSGFIECVTAMAKEKGPQVPSVFEVAPGARPKSFQITQQELENVANVIDPMGMVAFNFWIMQGE